MTDQQTAMQRYTADQAEFEDAARDVVRIRDQIDRYGPHVLPGASREDLQRLLLNAEARLATADVARQAARQELPDRAQAHEGPPR
jgi:hypothetical protein